MGTVLTSLLTALAKTTPGAATLADAGTEPTITEPIDRGAQALLQSHVNAYLQYPPLEVEYLLQTLNEHLFNCMDIRQKAQDLEVRAFTEASDQLLQRNLLDSLDKQAELFATYEPQMLGNTVKAKLEGGTVGGSPVEYWSQMLAQQKAQIDFKKKDTDARLKRLTETGGGANFVARFEFLKKLFDLDLVEAYSRARSASLGLKTIYGLDLPVPDVTDNGYLDKLVLWARNATYSLEKKLFFVRETTVAFALHDNNQGDDVPRIMTVDAFRTARGSGTFTFTIPQAFFERPNLKLKNPRLRGLDAHVWVNETRAAMQFWRVRVNAPDQKLNVNPGAPAWVHEPVVFVPMAAYPDHVNEDLDVPNQREVHNVSPIGEWTVRIEPRSIVGQGTNDNGQVDNIILRMRVAYERE